MSGDKYYTVNPLLILFKDGERVACHIHPAKGYTHEHYGMLVCDIVRNVAHAFEVPEARVWEWVDKERAHPTTPIDFSERAMRDLPHLYKRPSYAFEKSGTSSRFVAQRQAN
ncbi:MAG TPA: hypothetical protein VKB89_09330 [Xanthobacteraceae bacterium]|nr:hypothetical protein [Xanthobacteraceae bacterium]